MGFHITYSLLVTKELCCRDIEDTVIKLKRIFLSKFNATYLLVFYLSCTIIKTNVKILLAHLSYQSWAFNFMGQMKKKFWIFILACSFYAQQAFCICYKQINWRSKLKI